MRLGAVRSEFGDDAPCVTAVRKLLVAVLDPHDGNVFLARLLHEAADVGDDGVAIVSALDDALLHVDDEERGVRPVLECRHGFSFRSSHHRFSARSGPGGCRRDGLDVGVEWTLLEDPARVE